MKAFIFGNIGFPAKIIFYFFLLSSSCLFSQADLTIGGYFQNFGTTAISWTSGATSGTMEGWYYSAGNNRGNVNITGTNAPTPNANNGGGIYTYTCGGNAMIGSRAAGSPNNNIYYGVRLRNTSGVAITRIEVNFDWFQVSLAQNQENTNTIQFHYQVGSALTSLTTGAWTAVPTLNFSSVSDDNSGNSSQIQWYPPCQPAYADQRGANSECIMVSIPAGSEIMLRWYDLNDPANDHHMGIDNISVIGYPAAHNPTTCASPLAIDLLNFRGSYKHHQTNLFWETLSEKSNSYFTISRSQDGINWENIGRISGAGNSDEFLQYEFTDYSPLQGMNYYHLQSTDFDGTFYDRGVVAVDMERQYLYFNALTSTIELMQSESVAIYSLDGKLIHSSSGVSSIPFTHSGVFLIHYTEKGTTERIVINSK